MSPLADFAGPGGDLLGMLRPQGESFPAGGRDSRLLALRRSLKNQDQLERLLRAKREQGWPGLVAMGDPRLFAALRGAGSAAPAALPVVPNLQGFMREAVEYGLVGAGMRRARRVGLLGLAGLGLRSVGRAPQILRRDFPTMLRSFVELELSEWSRADPPIVFLQEQMTDLALAMDNPRIVAAFAEVVRRRTGAGAGFVTNNLGQLVASLLQWGIDPAAVITPWDASGRRLRPTPADSISAARSMPGKVYALRRDWITPPADADRQSVSATGVAGLIREDLEVWRLPS